MAYIWQQTLRAEKNTKGRNGKQILLIHANLLNSLCLEDIIELYKKNGYKFISLADALKGNTSESLSHTEAVNSVIPSIMEAKQKIESKLKSEHKS